MTSRSSPWTFSRFFTKKPSSLSSTKNFSNLGRSRRRASTVSCTVFIWLRLKVTTPRVFSGCLSKCSKTRSATTSASLTLFLLPPRS